mmetsp:Transcript_4154/g.11904  ORF Transcript_4154/g.11904 Transcript_4154/m.11904 type:complete len:119 (+) Transcript_4154:1464-1820(+)
MKSRAARVDEKVPWVWYNGQRCGHEGAFSMHSENIVRSNTKEEIVVSHASPRQKRNLVLGLAWGRTRSNATKAELLSNVEFLSYQQHTQRHQHFERTSVMCKPSSVADTTERQHGTDH